MIEFIILVLAISVFLYAFLAGADFGAGILELFSFGIPREKRSRAIGKAMGPVWEANHMWLILALVISFNAFPRIFWFFSEFFHFPLGALVIGIIFRGASFTFLHYDPIKDSAQKVYHWIFGLSSLWCTVWIGIIAGSLMLGNFSLSDLTMWERYFGHWLAPFPVIMGIFTTLLMAFNAGLFLALEETEEREKWLLVTKRIFVLLIVTGAIVHGLFLAIAPHRWELFFLNPLSLSMIVLSGVLLFPQYQLIRKGSRNLSRMVAGLQLGLIIGAAFLPIFPRVVLFRDFTSLDFYGTAAPPSVLYFLTIALVIGCLFILPAYGYLMKIFKYRDEV
jgi:cytochrome d ubiquinol oxidase subunit II